MGIKKRLSDKEAASLGIKPKKGAPSDGNRNPKYYLNNQKLKEFEKLSKLDFQPDFQVDADEIDNTTDTPGYEPQPFVMSAWDDKNGKVLSIEDYCKKYNLEYSKVKSYKFLPHHYKHPSYHIAFNESSNEDDFDFEELKEVLKEELTKTYSYKPTQYSRNCENAIKWADLHIGAHIRNLLRTPDYDSNILTDMIFKSVSEQNSFGFKVNHVHIMGDIIESWSGLNHVNSWMSMDKEETYSNVVRVATKILDHALSRIDNLGCVKIVGGNHDRGSKNNDEDVKGSIADVIAFCLEIKGYDVEFHPYIITHEIEGVNHILLHGDKKVSNRTTEEIVLKYGKPGMFNFIFQAHLHTLIELLAVKTIDAKRMRRIKTIKDDGIDKRHVYCPPFFSGNYYSETLGFDTNSGYMNVFDNGYGKPNMWVHSI